MTLIFSTILYLIFKGVIVNRFDSRHYTDKVKAIRIHVRS
jgi:hypothetical protein